MPTDTPVERDSNRGVTVRPAGAGDGAAVGRIRVAAWRDAYAGIVPDDYLAGMDPEGEGARAEAAIAMGPGPRRLVVAELDGAVAGFAIFTNPDHAESHAKSGRTGELHLIYVDPPAQGRGVGRALLARVFADVAGRLDALDVWCLADNAPARRFYERSGAAPLDGSRHFTLSDTCELAEVGYRWTAPGADRA